MYVCWFQFVFTQERNSIIMEKIAASHFSTSLSQQHHKSIVSLLFLILMNSFNNEFVDFPANSESIHLRGQRNLCPHTTD